jgi:hypothetical protein
MRGFEVHAPTHTFATCRVFHAFRPGLCIRIRTIRPCPVRCYAPPPPRQELVAMEESLMKQQLKERYRGTRSALLLKGK